MPELRTVPLTKLRPSPYNPRVPLRPGMPGYEKLRRSLDEFGLVQPLVWNEDSGHVVGGHQRLEILRADGRTEVDVIVVNLTPDREKALNIALNNTEVGGQWDPEKLIDLIGELQAVPDFDATLTGFDEAQLRDLILAPADLPETDDDAEPKPDRVVVTLEVPPAVWDDVRPELDALVAGHELRVHVEIPR